MEEHDTATQYIRVVERSLEGVNRVAVQEVKLETIWMPALGFRRRQ